MSRVIKFRACSEGIMSKPFYLGSVLCQSYRGHLMQYTGLKDKNSVEIYEGDIIKLCNNNNGFFEVIFKNSYQGGWNLKNKSDINTVSLGARHESELEIIGNIHQTPELL